MNRYFKLWNIFFVSANHIWTVWYLWNLWTCQILPTAVLQVKLCGPACDHKINQKEFYICLHFLKFLYSFFIFFLLNNQFSEAAHFGDRTESSLTCNTQVNTEIRKWHSDDLSGLSLIWQYSTQGTVAGSHVKFYGGGQGSHNNVCQWLMYFGMTRAVFNKK